MTTPFCMSRDINGMNGFGLIPTDTQVSVTLTALTDTTYTIPETFTLGRASSTLKAKVIAIIASDPGSSVWVALNATAAVPVGATFAATTSALNPSAYEVQAGDVLHCISSGTPSVSIRLYWLET